MRQAVELLDVLQRAAIALDAHRRVKRRLDTDSYRCYDAPRPPLVTPLLRIVHRVITRFLVKQAGLRRDAADTGAVTLSSALARPPI